MSSEIELQVHILQTWKTKAGVIIAGITAGLHWHGFLMIALRPPVDKGTMRTQFGYPMLVTTVRVMLTAILARNGRVNGIL